MIPKLPSFIAESSLLHVVYAFLNIFNWHTICWNYFRSWDHFWSNLGTRTVLKNQNHCCWCNDCLEPLLLLTILHYLSLQEAGSTRSQHRNHRWFCEMQDDYTLPSLNTLWWWPSHFIFAGLSIFEPHYSYFHWSANRIYIKVSFMKKIAMRRRSKLTSVLNNLGMNLSVN